MKTHLNSIDIDSYIARRCCPGDFTTVRNADDNVTVARRSLYDRVYDLGGSRKWIVQWWCDFVVYRSKEMLQAVVGTIVMRVTRVGRWLSVNFDKKMIVFDWYNTLEFNFKKQFRTDSPILVSWCWTNCSPAIECLVLLSASYLSLYTRPVTKAVDYRRSIFNVIKTWKGKIKVIYSWAGIPDFEYAGMRNQVLLRRSWSPSRFAYVIQGRNKPSCNSESQKVLFLLHHLCFDNFFFLVCCR